ncbi:hypothetical protein [Streptomyces sp. NBC_01618]|uniref:hypothetical protein n=1 Tax=Streptomyces sp. NBC_01618 TaxID=2975900 RepID=UPI00386DCA60|nr:hypothetical protein OH735_00005 [Streptomyces sp. NBC_01618]WTE38375.1 hypothetical protein OH735_38420 [Streptomyces sp. NBC_01618]
MVQEMVRVRRFGCLLSIESVLLISWSSGNLTGTQSPTRGALSDAKTIDAASRLTIHIAGDHETNASIGLTIIPLLKIPTAIIEFRHPTGARVWWEGWCEAAEMLDRIFPEQVDAGELREPELTINSFVILDGAPRRAKIRARSAAVSPDGIGALSVTVGGLTIACASRNAVECQVRGWREAYDMFARDGGFGLPSADEVAARVRTNHARHAVKLSTPARNQAVHGRRTGRPDAVTRPGWGDRRSPHLPGVTANRKGTP